MTMLPDDLQLGGSGPSKPAGPGTPPAESSAADRSDPVAGLNPTSPMDADAGKKKSPAGAESSTARAQASDKQSGLEAERGVRRGYAASRQATRNANRIDAGEVRGAGVVAGDQTVHFHYTAASESSARQVTAWEDELIAVHHLPPPSKPVPEDQISTRLQQLLATRLLLVRHAPSRQDEAESAMRAVLLALRARDPARQAYCSDRYGAIRLETLHRATSWRADRQGVVIYMYRDDAETLNFFATVERVSALCRRLEDMNCHLVLTAAALPGALLRDESEMSQRIALWSLGDDAAPAPAADLGLSLSDGFDVTLAMLAGLFPGLALQEFTRLVDRLQPRPPEPKPVAAPPASVAMPVSSPPAEVPPPPNRHQRWWAGARDAVLRELQIRLMAPPLAGAEGPAQKDTGMYFDTAERRADVQAWLYQCAPIRLCESIETLTDHYLSAAASNRFCVAYRRLLRALDAMGIHPVTSDWLAARFRARVAAERADLSVLVARMAELLSEWPDDGQAQGLAESFMSRLAAFVAEEERRLASRVAQIAWPGEDELTAPYAAQFWTTLAGQPELKDAIEGTATRQAVAMDLLMLLVTWFPAPAGKAIGTALADSLAAYDGWPQPDGPVADLPPVVSLARVVSRDLQLYLLRHSPGHWVQVAEAVGSPFAAEQGAKPDPEATSLAAGPPKDRSRKMARWLLWDAALVLTSALEDMPPPSPLTTALLSDAVRARTTRTLAALWRATLPANWGDPDKRPSADALHVDPDAMLWVYHLLAVAAVQQAPADAGRPSHLLGELLAPVRGWLTRSQRLDLIDLGSLVLDEEMALRDQLEGRKARNEATQRIQALQLIMRLLRSAQAVATH